MIPDPEMLAEAYRRQRRSAYLKKHFGELLERSRQHIASLDVSPDLHGHVAQLLDEQRALSWDDAIAKIARTKT